LQHPKQISYPPPPPPIPTNFSSLGAASSFLFAMWNKIQCLQLPQGLFLRALLRSPLLVSLISFFLSGWGNVASTIEIRFAKLLPPPFYVPTRLQGHPYCFLSNANPSHGTNVLFCFPHVFFFFGKAPFLPDLAKRSITHSLLVFPLKENFPTPPISLLFRGSATSKMPHKYIKEILFFFDSFLTLCVGLRVRGFFWPKDSSYGLPPFEFVKG